MADAITLQDLLVPTTLPEIDQTILAYLQQRGFPVTDWIAGGVAQTMVLAFSSALQDYINNVLPLITAGGYVDYATGDWLTLLSAQRFGITRVAATQTVGQIQFSTVASNAGPYTVSDSELIVQFGTGNRYLNVGSAVIAQGAVTTLNFISQFANNSSAQPPLNYTDAAGANTDGYLGALTLVTSLPGVLINNPPILPPVFTFAGSGTGTLTTSAYTGADSMNIVVTMITNGQAGVAEWSYSVNAGAAITGTSSSFTITYLDSSITITLNNSAQSLVSPFPPSFIEQDVYSLNLPPSWITTQGRDAQTDQSLQVVDKEVWGFNSGLATNSNLDILVREASDQVVLTDIFTDGYVNNKVNIVVAGQGAIVLSPATITAIQSYVQARVEISDFIVIESPIQQPITLVGQIYVVVAATTPALTTIQQDVEAAISVYIGTININGTIRLSELITAICSVPGVSYLEIGTMTINGSNSDYVLGNNATNNFQVALINSGTYTGLQYNVS
jgi:hypothetical protein